MNYENFEHELYTNQSCIELHKPKNPKETWFSTCKEDMCFAATTLSKGAFLLYMYIISNIDGYKFGLSPAAVNKAVGISTNTYHRAIAELKERKYLVYYNEFVKGTNGVTAPKWHFYSRPTE